MNAERYSDETLDNTISAELLSLALMACKAAIFYHPIAQTPAGAMQLSPDPFEKVHRAFPGNAALIFRKK